MKDDVCGNFESPLNQINQNCDLLRLGMAFYGKY